MLITIICKGIYKNREKKQQTLQICAYLNVIQEYSQQFYNM